LLLSFEHLLKLKTPQNLQNLGEDNANKGLLLKLNLQGELVGYR
jgi:hypothetical protein